MAFKLYVFDAYGTLFDVHCVMARHRQAIGPQAERMSEIWRTKQLEYTWVRSLMGAYRDFSEVTAAALDFAAARCGVSLTREQRDLLLESYQSLDAYPDVAGALERLRRAGAQTAILSNGTAAMLARLADAAGLTPHLDARLSVDDVQAYKTVPAVYELVGRKFHVRPDQVSFQSSNRWDVAGAVKFGFRTVWINRTGQPDEYGDLPPALVVNSLAELADHDT